MCCCNRQFVCIITPFWSAWSLKPQGPVLLCLSLNPITRENVTHDFCSQLGLTWLYSEEKKLQACVRSDYIVQPKKSQPKYFFFSFFRFKSICENSSWHLVSVNINSGKYKCLLATQPPLFFYYFFIFFQPWRAPVWAAFQKLLRYNTPSPMENSISCLNQESRGEPYTLHLLEVIFFFLKAVDARVQGSLSPISFFNSGECGTWLHEYRTVL